MLVVIDTDILVSTAGHPDKRFALWEAVRAGRVTAVTCDVAITELEDVAARLIVRSAMPLLAENFPLFLAEYRLYARLIPPPRNQFVLHIDPKDSLFFNIAIETQAQILYAKLSVAVSCEPIFNSHWYSSCVARDRNASKKRS